MPATDSANGTTFSFGGTAVSTVRDVSFDSDANVIDTTNFADVTHRFVDGIPTETLTVELIGSSAIVAGETASNAIITWPDASNHTITNALCSAKSTSGSVDAPVVSNLTIVQFDA